MWVGGSDVWEKFPNNIVFLFESVPKYIFVLACSHFCLKQSVVDGALCPQRLVSFILSSTGAPYSPANLNLYCCTTEFDGWWDEKIFLKNLHWLMMMIDGGKIVQTEVFHQGNHWKLVALIAKKEKSSGLRREKYLQIVHAESSNSWHKRTIWLHKKISLDEIDDVDCREGWWRVCSIGGLQSRRRCNNWAPTNSALHLVKHCTALNNPI